MSDATKLAILLNTLLFSCHANNKTAENRSIVHPQLISFQSVPVLSWDQYIDSGLEKRREIASETFDPKTDTVQYKTDTLYISYLIAVNSCGKYDGNIRFEKDTILLIENNFSETLCESQRVDRFMFTIHNPSNQVYAIKRKFNTGFRPWY